ncbi:hypothetical protein [Allorhodopirellula heiligendammensis]|uniref:Uncharacterized protein n=1 Tax=Allorhodopirellula heiligendammensis TaxID=2714739 RepID=A0A5C6C3Q0_9BACT|nr:hypothetical protein [Allorhodopirellula heiligendammensis]TWU19200.1 hypothetical protein Poly21_13710 [Allorhodopirellula heiligendammensis]
MNRLTPQSRRTVKRAWRMAGLVKTAVDRHCSQQEKTLRVPSADKVKRWQRLISVARSRQYHGAERSLGKRMLDALNDLQREVDDAIYVAAASMAPRRSISLAGVTADLLAIEAEFPACDFDFTKKTIAVTTEPIEIEYTHLGAFRIELELKYLGQSCPYRVVAVDPNPTTSCDSTTHPHVQSETLCEGEGHGPIKLALTEGRLHDFFTVVNQILHTYNPHSAYTTLGDWSGTECRDCGSTVDEDDLCSCDQCDAQICSGCTCSCDGCSETHCDDCMTKCEGCQDSFCGSCISSCDRCNKPFCQDCLTEEKCDDCVNEEEGESTSDPSEESSEPAVHALCVGETAIPA